MIEMNLISKHQLKAQSRIFYSLYFIYSPCGSLRLFYTVIQCCYRVIEKTILSYPVFCILSCKTVLFLSYPINSYLLVHIPRDNMPIVENVWGGRGRRIFVNKTSFFLPIIWPPGLPDKLWNLFIKQPDTANQTPRVQFAYS